MKLENNIGEKIKNYRLRSGISQMDLELAIDASFGSVSRIESRKVNPTKETIIEISKALKLDTHEIASLFGLDIHDLASVMNVTTTILSHTNLNEITHDVVNELTFKMGYLASFLVLQKSDKLHCVGLTNSNISKATFEILNTLGKNVTDISLSISKDISNPIVDVYNNCSPKVVTRTRELIYPALPKIIGDAMQKATGDESYIVYPLQVGGKTIGVIIFAKKIKSDFESDMQMIDLVSKQIAIAIKNSRKADHITGLQEINL